ncbi:MAG TPA: Ldh family oxidoreductase [Chloroflexota bacterium]|nr:Ldh family oxidoreductase [Chloroflexota bacterium]
MEYPTEGLPRVPAEKLKLTVAGILEKCGLPPGDAAQAADGLVAADLYGVTSHGVSQILRNYVQRLKDGGTNPHPNWRVVRETPAAANVDCDRGMGLVVVPKVMELAIEKARKVGVGMVSLRNARHLGMAQYHARLALPHDMIGMCMTATSPFMVPTYGSERRLGTNPIAFAAPCDKEPPFVYDAATTVSAGNKLIVFNHMGLPVPGGFVAREDGMPVMEPTMDVPNHMLLPLGSTPDTASHKGYGLAAMVEVLCGVLGGLTFGARKERDNYNHFVAAINVDAFQPVDEFKQAMDDFVRTLRETPPAPGCERVLYPGLPEWEAEQDRRANGIPLHPSVLAWFDQACEELGLPGLER